MQLDFYKINPGLKKFSSCISLTSANNQISELRIPNIYNEIFVLIL